MSDAVATPPPCRGLVAYALIAGVVSLAGSMVLAGSADAIARAFGIESPTDGMPEWSVGWVDLAGLVVFAPVVETLLLSALLWGLARVIASPVRVAAVSALLWGGLHGAVAPMWFFGTVWAFFVFSYAYLAWRPRSYRHAFAAAALPHAMQNAAAFGLLALASTS
ncbi:CPBP family glutamic-type intramembrane protease [Cognatilysobacter bugurensis]|uniref:CAAX prenyl protease 2/Lysostaphin resistance protein A-like domain-containing protein n=1 Tax=Cognatilysobacter bugurensis TaxID=543356 RepID=A0A918W7J5_9GAMM|nr:CPBP family glutamic-type intramembrane protease [Lysobacter bugurensis]GHA81893.1 hypothetical protein GCM10007067_19730 [Lysobacter bugurensis]